MVKPLAEQHGLSERVLATQGHNNLKGRAKADALVELFGEGGFDYAGNASVDCAIWKRGDVAYVVGDAGSAEVMRALGKEVRELPGGWTARALIKSFRPHQWVKNVLLFLPLIAAHDFSAHTIILALLGILS
ncbi:prenyltransferase, partial [Pseudomonas fluorescens]